jgi:hypothetical protein
MRTPSHTARFLPLLLLLFLLPAAAAERAPPITIPFDHLSTGFELDGVHRELPCESCHLDAMFKGTPRDCGTCHIQGSRYNATPKTATHIPSSNNCAACHNTIAFRPDVHFQHREVMGSCASCHNGVIAQGEAPTHPATSQNCASCHSVLTWNPPTTVDHSQIPLAVSGFCIICHNGTQAAGKPANHIATNLECGDCHLTTTWLGADFDHTGITTGCVTCHNGTKAVGKQGTHMPTSNLCENCHTTGIGTKLPSWTPAIFDHTQMSVTTCATCHSGSVKISTGFVSGQPANHVPPIPSAIDCAVCHGNTPSAETWTVLAASIATLHSGLPVSNCLMCHAGQTFAGVPTPYVPMSTSGVSPSHPAPLSPLHIPVLVGSDCSACHGAAYQTGGFGPATAMNAAKHAFVSTACNTCHDTGKSFYVGSGTPLQLRPADHVASGDPKMASGDCSGCHETTDWNSTALPAGHMPNPGNLSCTQCHTAAPGDYTPATLAAYTVLHTGISSNCGLCHGSMTTALTWANNYTPKDAILAPGHIPYLQGTDCSSCHAGNYVAGGFGNTAMSVAKHAFVPASCDTCHEAGLSFYPGAALNLQGRPADHVSSGGQQATGDCSGCHNTTDWSSNTMPPGHMPNPGNQACTVCHTAIGSTIATYAVLASVSVLHTGITTGCAQCHGSPSGQLTFYNNNDNPIAAVLTPAHIPYSNGVDCSACHASNYVTGGFGGTTMSAAKHAFVPTTCDTCHEAGLNFYPGAALALQGRPATHVSNPNPASQATGDCSLCHNTTTWTTPTTLPNGHMPIPGTQTCSVCHVGTLTADPNSYATLASIPVLHTGITNGCAQCHGGSTALTFYNNNDNPKAAASLAPPHIPAFTGEDCSACHAANYVVGGFGPMNMTQATHAGVGSTCNSCHEAGLSFYMGAASPGLQGRPADHTGSRAAPADCSACHTTANWNSTALPSGHMPNPANTACATCHTAAPTNYTTLAANSVLHTGISSGCGQCHGGTTALTWYNNFTPKDAVLAPPHIPYLSGTDCGSCHSSSTYAAGTFGPMNMTQAKHAFVSSTCATCHEKGLSFYMGTASPALQGRPADHTSGAMLTGDCGGCHTTANWNSTTLPSGHMPNPANTACATCHTAAPANYTTLAANPVLHTGITTGCIACHGAPNAAAPVFYLNYTPKDALLSPVHIPTSTTPCEACHAVSFTAFSGTTMSSAKHTSMFAVIGKTCDQCHDASTLKFYGVSNLTTRPNGHHVGQDCSGCHNTNNWNGGAAQTAGKKTTAAVVTAVARAPAGTTATAPAAVTAAGRFAAGSIAAGSIAALGTRAAVMPTVSHAGVTANCVSCHNGVLVSGKGAAHIASNNACQNCHITPAWLPARFDHQGIVAACSSCHNGVQAAGLPPKHIVTSQDCRACHGTISWTAVAFSHLNLTGTCASCHNGINVAGKQPNHPLTTQDCAACHNTQSWAAIVSRTPRNPPPPKSRVK